MTWIDPPGDSDPHSLAEFIEAELLFSEDDYFSLTEIRGLFSLGSQPTDEELSFALMEMEKRAIQWGSHYPYLVDDRGVYFDRADGGTLYSFLMLMSLKGMPVRENREFPRSDRVFDAVAREAFRSERGPKAQALIFASPARDGRPPGFKKAIKWVGARIGVGVRAGASIPGHYQDAGIDIIVWRPFPDGRNGFQIMLVQNTVQWSFKKKPYEVRPLKWFAWLNLGTTPSVGFAVPFSIPEGDIWWADVTDGADLVMDRGRLLHALESEDPTSWPEWDSLKSFVSAELTSVRANGAPAVPELMVPKARMKTAAEKRAT